VKPSESNPPSLASLRGRKRGAKPAPVEEGRAAEDIFSQMGLLFVAPETSSEPSDEAVERVVPEPAKQKQERRVWSVQALVGELRGHIEREYLDVWVEGEISNCRAAPSGHVYFTLKDGEAQLPVVLFRRQATLLRFKPQDGQAVLVRGHVSVYESRGQLQLIAETLEPRGAGALQLAFEQLKAKLMAEGLFDEERKISLPLFPKTIGVITSPSGAVIRDIVNVCRRRHGGLNILVYPALMQGVGCAEEVAAGIRYFHRDDTAHRVDVIVLARGGGSLEDLAGFNDEALARTIAGATLPIVSAIGHETDFTIADFVADLRAPTPSAAAELVTAGQHRIEEHVDALYARVVRAMRYQGMHARQRLMHVGAEAIFARLRDLVARREQRVDELRFRLQSASVESGRIRWQRLQQLQQRLERQSVTERIAKMHARLERLQRRLHAAPQRSAVVRERLHRADQRLAMAAQRRVQRLRLRYETNAAQLEAMSPNAVLARGYALVFAVDGSLLRSVSNVEIGEEITARLARGCRPTRSA